MRFMDYISSDTEGELILRVVGLTDINRFHLKIASSLSPFGFPQRGKNTERKPAVFRITPIFQADISEPRDRRQREGYSTPLGTGPY